MGDKYIGAIRKLATIRALDAETAEKLLVARAEDGGKGSGNFGHKGRPGKRGGSAKRGEGGSASAAKSGKAAHSEAEKFTSPADMKGKVLTVGNKRGAKTVIRQSKENPNEFEFEHYSNWSSHPAKGTMNMKAFKNELLMADPEETKIESVQEINPSSESFGPGGAKEPSKAVKKIFGNEKPVIGIRKIKNENGDYDLLVSSLPYTGGKRIIVPGINHTPEMAAKAWCKANKIDPGEDEIEAVWNPDQPGWNKRFNVGGSGKMKESGSEFNKPSKEDMRSKMNWLAWNYAAYGKEYPGERKKYLEQWNDNVEAAKEAGLTGKELNDLFHKPDVDEARKYVDEHPDEDGDEWETTGEPDNAITQNRKKLAKANMDAADWCFNEKKNYPVGSDEYKAYERYEKTLSEKMPGRPTPAESAELIQNNLSNVSGQLKPYAVERYKRDLQDEPNITSDICDIADDLGTEMYGLKYRIKGVGDKVVKDKNDNPVIDPKTGKPRMVCRYQEKVEQDIAEEAAKGRTLSYEDAVDSVSDLVRYTQACTEDNLVSNFERTRDALLRKGYKLAKVKNYYNVDPMENPYRGLNTVFISPNGTRFELQFHTPRSLVAKEAQHGLYEKARTDGVTEEEKEEYARRMREISSKEKVPCPKGIEKIENYPPKKS